MGFHTDYCFICGGPVVFNTWNKQYFYCDGKQFEWLEKNFVIGNVDEIPFLHATGAITDGEFDGSTDDEGKRFIISPIDWNDEDCYHVVACHQDCYNLLLKELKFKIEFDDVVHELDYYCGVLADKKKYGVMEKYSFQQEFMPVEVLEENRWLLESPLESPLTCGSQNKQRILDTWRNFPVIANTMEVGSLLRTYLPLPSVLVTVIFEFYGKFLCK